MARILAIDYGKKKVGFAICDSFGITVTPLEQSPSQPEELFRTINIRIQEHSIEKILIGKPIYADGNASSMTRAVYEFEKMLRKKLENPSIEILLWDEQYTTHIAEERWDELSEKKIIRHKKKNKKENLDSYSAAILLESYLRESNTNHHQER